MATPDVEMHGFLSKPGSDSVLSESLGPDILEAGSMVLDAYRNANVAALVTILLKPRSV
jgi:hypothetical protein